MKKTDDLPYLEKKVEQDTVKEMIYGSGETLSELNKKSDDEVKQLLTE